MKQKLTTVWLLLLIAASSLAQDAPSMFAVYESQVKPSMDAVYRDAVKKFVAACKEQKMTFSWFAGELDDNSFIYMVPIKNFADLDKNMFTPLEAKIGKVAMASHGQAIDRCVENQTSSVVLFLPGLSYLSPTADDYYRDVFYWVPEAGKAEEAEKLITEWIALNKSKQTPLGIHTYRNIFGGETGYVFVSWGRNRADVGMKLQKRNELLGEELPKLWARTLLITKKYYTRTGWVAPALSYSP